MIIRKNEIKRPYSISFRRLQRSRCFWATSGRCFWATQGLNSQIIRTILTFSLSEGEIIPTETYFTKSVTLWNIICFREVKLLLSNTGKQYIFAIIRAMCVFFTFWKPYLWGHSISEEHILTLNRFFVAFGQHWDAIWNRLLKWTQ